MASRITETEELTGRGKLALILSVKLKENQNWRDTQSKKRQGQVTK